MSEKLQRQMVQLAHLLRAMSTEILETVDKLKGKEEEDAKVKEQEKIAAIEAEVEGQVAHEQRLLARVVSAVATYERLSVKCNLRVLSDAVGIPLAEAKRVLEECRFRRLVFQHGTNDDPDIRTKPVEEIPHFHGTDLPKVTKRNPLTP